MADINKIVAKFCTEGTATSISPCGNGLVNHTFVVNAKNNNDNVENYNHRDDTNND